MKATQVRICINPDTGRLWLYKASAGLRHRVKDITNDVLSVFAMDALVRGDGQSVVQEIELTDPADGFSGVVKMTLEKIA